MGKIISLLIIFFGTLQQPSAFAYTSIAVIKNQAQLSFFRSSNYAIQKEADIAALEGCRSAARQNGLGNMAKMCQVVTRPKGPGYGAIVCGDEGCAWTTAYGTSQEAVDAAYNLCSKTYKNCQEDNISYWEDFAGFSTKTTNNAKGGDCRPRSPTISCQSSCRNGDCLLTYKNGCQIRVQVNPNFNPISNQWEYPAPSC